MRGTGRGSAARAGAAGLLVLLAIVAAACSTPEPAPAATPESRRLLAEAATLESEGREDEALRRCETALERQPGLIAARVRAADLARRTGDGEAAAAHARAALAHPPEDPADRAVLARALAPADAKRARAILAPLLDASPARADVELAAADVALARNDRSAAMRHLRRAAAAQPTLPQKLDVARGLSHAGFHDDAVETVRDVISAGEASPETRYTLAWTLENAERYDECAREYFALVDDHPEHLPAYFRLGALMARDGELQRAVALWERGLRHHPGNEGLQANIDEALDALGLKREEGTE